MSVVLDSALARQDRVRSFLERSLASDAVSHAYLFVGPASANLEGAARSFAQALVCPDGGCGECAECQRVSHGTHPDVLLLSPESAQRGYLVDQVRDVIVQSSLSPVRAKRKVYVIRHAERLGVQAANALLKTLEEPASDVVFILLAPAAESVLTTIRSRCSVVPFSAVDPRDTVADLVARCGVDEGLASAVVAVTGSIDDARALLADERRLGLRERVLEVLGAIGETSDWALLSFADEVVAIAREDGDVLGKDLGVTEAEEDFLSSAALKDIRAQRKREGTARAKESIAEVIRVVDVVLADALARLSGSDEPPLDPAHADIASAIADKGLPAVLASLDITAEAARDLARPTTAALVLSVMFLRLKEALCPSSAQ